MRIIVASFLMALLPVATVSGDPPEILWWYDLQAPSFGSAAVADIDGDDTLEIVFGTYFNDERIHALNAQSGDTLWTFNTGGCNDASPAIADVDLDGSLEVIVPASSPSIVYCLDGLTGEVEWSTSTSPNCIDSPPAVADVDNDSLPEVIFGAFYGHLYCLNGEDGGECWHTNLGTNSFIQSGPNILDVDGNGQLDVVVAQWSGDCRVYALRGDDHSEIWHSDEPQDWMYHGGSFADVDEDGKPEIAIGCYDNNLYLLNAEDGSLEWEYPTSSYVGAPTSIADLNNDGHLEIVLVSYNVLIVISHDGDYLWSCATGGNIFRGAAIADVDGDDTLDVAFGSDDGILRVRRGSNGAEIWSYNLGAHYGDVFEMDHAPVIADLNNDGALDIFIIGGYGTSSPPTANHGRAYALMAGAGAGPGWPMFRHDLRHSGCFPTAPQFLCGDVDDDGQIEIADGTYLWNYIFYGSVEPPNPDAGDMDECGSVNVADIVYLFNYFGVPDYPAPCSGSVACDTPAGGNSISLAGPAVGCPADTVSLPILISSDLPLAAASIGLRFDCEEVEVIDVNLDGSVWSGAAISDIKIVPESLKVLLGFCETTGQLEPQTDALLATLRILISEGAVPQEVNFDSAYVDPCGEFILCPRDGGVIVPAYFDNGTADLIIVRAYLCGDADNNEIVNVSDAVYLVAYIFASGPPPEPLESGDVDCNEIVNVSDAVYLIAYIFAGGPEPCAACP